MIHVCNMNCLCVFIISDMPFRVNLYSVVTWTSRLKETYLKFKWLQRDANHNHLVRNQTLNHLDSNCNFNNFSLLVLYRNNLLVVCTCILYIPWHTLPHPHPPHPFSVFFWGLKIFFESCNVFHTLYLGAKKVTNLLVTYCIG